MKNEIKQHIPTFVDTDRDPPDRAEFSTLAELEAIPFVARWKMNADGDTFHRFSKSENCLMAELNGGRDFWVVGFIADPDAVNLPIWMPPKTATRSGTSSS
jgi:hypothetical protein